MPTPLRKAFPDRERWLLAALLAATVVALALAATSRRDAAPASGDERHFLAGAANLARHGQLDFGDPASPAVTNGLYREPIYPATIALAWSIAGVPAPASFAEIDALPTRRELYLPIRTLHLLCLIAAAVAVGWALSLLEGPVPGALGAALVAASPALARSGALVMSENLTAAAIAVLSAGLVALRTGSERLGGALTLIAAATLPLVRAETVLFLPLAAGAFAVAGLPLLWLRRSRAPWRRFALALVVLALPSLAWVVRNGLATGYSVLSDRGGMAFAVRAALDEDVARFGASTAALTFTPWEPARARARAMEPGSTLSDYRPEGSQNFLLRTYRRFAAERELAGEELVAVDRRLGREALAKFANFPGRHLVTSIVVAWRGLFAERSPAWAHPFDLALPLGLLLGFAVTAVAVFARHERDVARLLFVAPVLVLAAFHIAATEFLPRYALPLLPLLWGSVVLLASRALRHRRERADAPAEAPEPASPDAPSAG